MKFISYTKSIGNYISGGEMSIKFFEYGSGSPSIYIQGGTHGGELNFGIFHLLQERLKDLKVEGKLTLVPISNPVSWNQRVYYYTMGKFDFYSGQDWNRWFPGKPEGNRGQRIAFELFEIAKKHNAIVDLHTASKVTPFGVFDGEDDIEIAKILGLPWNLFYKRETSEKYKKMNMTPLSFAAKEAGKIAVTVECGAHDELDWKKSELVCESLLNLMNHLGMIKYKSKLKPGKYYYNLNEHRAPVTGILDCVIPLDGSFKRGQTLCKIYPPYDLGKVIEVKAEYDGIMARHARTNIVWVGDKICHTVKKEDINQL